jgi:hypothetical protein
MTAIEDQTKYVPSGLVTIPADNKVQPAVYERPWAEDIHVHTNNSCYVNFSDTDGMVDYFHGYSFNSLKSLIGFLLRDSTRFTHTIKINFVNNCIPGEWPQEKKDKIIKRFTDAGIPVKERD